MADHSFITLYAHIGRRIITAFVRGGRWVLSQLLTLFVVVLGIGYVLGLLLPFADIAKYCAV